MCFDSAAERAVFTDTHPPASPSPTLSTSRHPQPQAQRPHDFGAPSASAVGGRFRYSLFLPPSSELARVDDDATSWESILFVWLSDVDMARHRLRFGIPENALRDFVRSRAEKLREKGSVVVEWLLDEEELRVAAGEGVADEDALRLLQIDAATSITPYLYFTQEMNVAASVATAPSPAENAKHEVRLQLPEALHRRLQMLEEDGHHGEEMKNEHPNGESSPLDSTSTASKHPTAPHRSAEHRRMRVIHQDCLLPYQNRLTVNSFTIEMNLFRIHGLTPIHLYMNDDYFVNRNVPITKLVNEFGGVVTRADNLLMTAHKAPLGSTDWRAGVNHTNLFLIHEVDWDGDRGSVGSAEDEEADRATASGESTQRQADGKNRQKGFGGSVSQPWRQRERYLSVPPALMDLWFREGQAQWVRQNDSLSVRFQEAAEDAPYLLAQRMLDASDADTPTCWREALTDLFGTPFEEDERGQAAVARGERESTTRQSHHPPPHPENDEAKEGRAMADEHGAANASDTLTDPAIDLSFTHPSASMPRDAKEERVALWRRRRGLPHLPETLPRHVRAKHHRRFSMHAPFPYCTQMFRYLDKRYARELALHAFVNRRRAATDFHPPNLHNEFVLKRPWVSSDAFLPFVMHLDAYRAEQGLLHRAHDGRSEAATPLEEPPSRFTPPHSAPERGASPPCSALSSPRRACSSPRLPPPPPLSIALDNLDACAPATLLAQSEGESCFTKFTDDMERNVRMVKRIESKYPLFFNINTDFTWANVSVLMRTYLGLKFQRPIFLERSARQLTDKSEAAAPQDTFDPFTSPFYPLIKRKMRRRSRGAQRWTRALLTQTNATAKAAASSQKSDWEGNDNRSGVDTRPAASRSGRRSEDEGELSSPGLTHVPPYTTPFTDLFETLMQRTLPLILIADDDDEALCPLVRSLSLAMPQFKGRRLALVLIPPKAHDNTHERAGRPEQNEAGHTREGGGAVGGRSASRHDSSGGACDTSLSLPLRRARVRHPMSHAMPVTLCTAFIGSGYRRHFLHNVSSSSTRWRSSPPARPDDSTEKSGKEAEEGSTWRRAAPRGQSEAQQHTSEGRWREVERFTFAAGTPAAWAVDRVLSDMFLRDAASHGEDDAVAAAVAMAPESFLSRRIAVTARPATAAEPAPAPRARVTVDTTFVHAMVLDSRTDAVVACRGRQPPFSSLSGQDASTPRTRPPAPLSNATAAPGAGPEGPSTLKELQGGRRQRCRDTLSRALAVPGERLSLEDFTFMTLLLLTSPLPSARVAPATEDAIPAAIRSSRAETRPQADDAYLSHLRRYLLLLHHRCDNSSSNHSHSSAGHAACSAPTRLLSLLFAPSAEGNVQHGVLTLSWETSRIATVTNATSAVHWITGASELDLLSAFPLPSTLWEREDATARLSHDIIG